MIRQPLPTRLLVVLAILTALCVVEVANVALLPLGIHIPDGLTRANFDGAYTSVLVLSRASEVLCFLVITQLLFWHGFELKRTTLLLLTVCLLYSAFTAESYLQMARPSVEMVKTEPWYTVVVTSVVVTLHLLALVLVLVLERTRSGRAEGQHYQDPDHLSKTT
jgi:hypothetical protein